LGFGLGFGSGFGLGLGLAWKARSVATKTSEPLVMPLNRPSTSSRESQSGSPGQGEG